MRYTISFGGSAGSGINTIGLVFAEIFIQMGYKVLCDKEYESRIMGGSNIFVIYISDDVEFVSKTLDLFVSLDESCIVKFEKIYDISDSILIPKPETGISQNIFCIGMICKLLSLDYKLAEKILKNKFLRKGYEKILIDFDLGYKSQTTSRETFQGLVPKSSNSTLFFGNELIIESAIDHGLEFFSGYPMTPASSLIDVALQHKSVKFLQGEDEIAVSMAMLGSSFAGKISMCGTSGGGFALMSESISFAYQAEISGIRILSQRSGPSTGTPTFTEQSDITFAIHPTFGGVKPIVVSLSDFVSSYALVGKAIQWARKYQYPVIILTEKQFSESYVATDTSKFKRQDFTIKFGSDSVTPRYQITESGVSDYTLPGTIDREFITTSYEHDEYGVTTEDPIIKKNMTDKRNRKLESFVQTEFDSGFQGFEVTNPDAEYFYISTGFVKYTILSSLSDGKYGHIDIQVLSPIGPDLEHFLKSKNIKKLIFVEMNADGQLEKHITNEVRLYSFFDTKNIDRIRKYELYPIFSEDLGSEKS